MKNIMMISGRAGAGKDTLGKMFSYKRVAFADILKDSVSKRFSIDRNLLDTQHGKSLKYNEENTNRQILMEYATEMRIKDINYWCKAVVDTINEDASDNFVITDFRYPNEFDYISKNVKNSKVSTILVIRSDAQVINHHSETSLNDFKFDHIIYNENTIKEFEQNFRKILLSIKT